MKDSHCEQNILINEVKCTRKNTVLKLSNGKGVAPNPVPSSLCYLFEFPPRIFRHSMLSYPNDWKKRQIASFSTNWSYAARISLSYIRNEEEGSNS